MAGRSQSVAERKRSGTEQEFRAAKSAQSLLLSNGVERSSSRITSTSAKRRKQRKRSMTSATLSESPEEDLPPPPKPAWQQFSDHIKMFSTVGGSYTTANAELNHTLGTVVNKSGSDICKKILRDMKEQLEKKRAKEQLLLQKQRDAEASEQQQEMETLSEDSDYDDSDEEESEEKKQKRLKAEAIRYWDMIRRDVNERIRIRKEKNPAGGTWNALRSQLRALTRGNNVRQELYEKYGIIPKPGSKVAEDSMKPKLSVNIKEVVNRFQSFQVRKLKVTFA